jgi:hypothetical protein
MKYAEKGEQVLVLAGRDTFFLFREVKIRSPFIPSPSPTSTQTQQMSYLGSPRVVEPPKMPVIEGWLEKQGGVRKSWKRRYFALDGKNLKYYRKKEDVAQGKHIDAIPIEKTIKVGCRLFVQC